MTESPAEHRAWHERQLNKAMAIIIICLVAGWVSTLPFAYGVPEGALPFLFSALPVAAIAWLHWYASGFAPEKCSCRFGARHRR